MQTKSKQKPLINPHLQEKLGFILLGLMSLITVIPIIALIIFVLNKGISVISWEFLSGLPENGMRSGGIYPAIIGTIYLTLGTALFSVPPGIARRHLSGRICPR